MPDFAVRLGASKAASTLFVLHVPSKDRSDQEIDNSTGYGPSCCDSGQRRGKGLSVS